MSSPIIYSDKQLITKVEDKVIDTLFKVEKLYRRTFDIPKIEWDLRGTVAGKAFHQLNKINLNWVLLKENNDAFIERTVPHEIVHLVNRKLNPYAKQSHGPEWKRIMMDLGLPPTRCHSYDTTNSRVRRKVEKPYELICNCKIHNVSRIVWMRFSCGKTSYTCRECKSRLRRA